MIKIPQDGKFSQPNNSDKFGNLWYTKNINLDEEGYIKLSPRAVSLVNSTTDADLGIPISFGREQGGVFNIVTTDKPFEVTINTNTLSAAIDNGTSRPALTFDSFGAYWQNVWHVTDDNDLFYRTPSTGNWTDANVTLTASKLHPIALFRNRNELCIGNGNEVVQVNTSYTPTTNLALPADFEVCALAYNNNKMGIATRLSNTVEGQNQSAYFFIWDGGSTEAEAGYDVGSDAIVSVVAYKSSWVLITRTGNVLYFNGGGFDTLASFPFYFLDYIWGDSRNAEAVGDMMVVDGDVIYININNRVNQYGKKNERAVQNSPGGVWCYDPAIGLYHRYSLSVSPINKVSVTPSTNVDTSTNILTAASGTLYATGNPIKYLSDGASMIGGLKSGEVYYIIKLSASTFKLAETKELALAGVAVDLLSQATGVFMHLNLLDFGQTLVERTGGIGLQEETNSAIGGLIFGSELNRVDSVSDNEHLCFITNGFSNRGFVVTPRISSQKIKDVNQKAFIKFRPLNQGDKIILKAKDRDVLGIPVSTPQYTAHCVWDGDNSFHTTNGTVDFSEVKAYLDAHANNECEVEIISGNGAGQMAQIESIAEETNASGQLVYSVVLKEHLEGITAGYYCNVIIDNWKKLGEITSENTSGYQEFQVGTTSNWVKFKIELRGSDTTIEEFQFVSQNSKNAV